MDVLKLINNLLYRECSSCIPLGLKGGKLGIAIFWALYSEKVMNASCRKRATRILNDIIVNIELLSDSFLSGKMGFGWGMFFLINRGILSLDSEMQNLLNYISRLSSYSLDGHPFQLSLDDCLFSKGICKLKQRTCYENISRYIIDEELIVFVDECENLLSCKIEKIYTPEQLTLQELNSLLYFLKEIKSRKIFPFKANLLISRIEELYNKKKITFDSFIRGILTAMVIIGILYLVNRLSGVLLPFFIAWLIAYLTYPMVIFFQNKLRLRNRVISILVVLLVLLSIITLAFVGLVPPIIEEFGKLKELLTAYFIEGSKQAAIPGTVANFIKEHIDMLKIHEALNESNFANTMRNVLPQVWALLTQSVNIVFSVFTSFIILLYTFFILLDYEAIARGWIKLIPARHREMTVHIVTDVQDGMNKYFRGQAFVAFCVGILFSIGFLIIDFPLAIGFGLFIGLLNMVPYLQLIAFIPTVLLALLKAADTGENFWWILFCAFLVFCIVQIIQDGLIVPKVMGKITGLNPAIILLSLSVWGALMGIVGMIIALPCTSLMLSYYQRYIRIKEKEFSGGIEHSDFQHKENSNEK